MTKQLVPSKVYCSDISRFNSLHAEKLWRKSLHLNISTLKWLRRLWFFSTMGLYHQVNIILLKFSGLDSATLALTLYTHVFFSRCKWSLLHCQSNRWLTLSSLVMILKLFRCLISMNYLFKLLKASVSATINQSINQSINQLYHLQRHCFVEQFRFNALIENKWPFPSAGRCSLFWEPLTETIIPSLPSIMTPLASALVHKIISVEKIKFSVCLL